MLVPVSGHPCGDPYGSGADVQPQPDDGALLDHAHRGSAWPRGHGATGPHGTRHLPAAAMVANAKARGPAPTGPDGLCQLLTKNVGHLEQ